MKEKLYILLAQTNPDDVPTRVDPVPGGTDLTVAQVIVNIVNFILSFAAALAVLMIIIGGIRYIVSAGNQDAIDQARKIIIYSVVGIVIIVLSFVLVNFVITTTPVIVPPQSGSDSSLK